ncbi:hypothetical protein TCAL_07847 [Tigriopus californicus]|uniref:Otopetrin n=1 Tax=Tigriopus californicus TaxID=6832 RepID=A0A553PL70_TIGCA|nr:hypothetical protein TCAL_07847 [Tigriopus californicus]
MAFPTSRSTPNFGTSHRNHSKISLHALHLQATRFVEEAPVFTHKSLSSIHSAFSSLYAMVLVTLFLAFSYTEVVTFPRFHHYLENYGFYIYLYGVADLFFIYVLSIAIWSERKKTVLDNLRIVLNHKSHGCLPARIGIIFFGCGTLIYLILELIAFFMTQSSLQCYHSTDGANSILGILFVLLQACLIFMFGTMHVVATNIIVWIHSIISESLYEFEEAEDHRLESVPTNVTNMGCDFLGERLKGVYDLNHRCEKNKVNIIGYALSKMEHFLYPFIIEFALIGASVFFVMWRHIGRHSHPSVEQPHLDVKIHRPRPLEFIKRTAWDHSLKGAVAGIFILFLAVLNLVLFFNAEGAEHNNSQAEYFSKLTKILINVCGILALVIGIWQIQFLEDIENIDKAEAENRNLDTALLRFTSFFAYLYQCFTIITGIFNANANGFPVQLHDLNAIIAAIQITLQLVFIFDLRWKKLPQNDSDTKPGRQVAIFMFFFNIGMWLVFTFEIQKVRSSLVEAHFYGFMPWVIIQRVTLPLTIFFRFHSAVVNIEMWKNIYNVHPASQHE